MTAHELAKLLLDGPDLPVATHANGHSYSSEADARSHGKINVARAPHYTGEHIMIGNWRVQDLQSGPYRASPTSPQRT